MAIDKKTAREEILSLPLVMRLKSKGGKSRITFFRTVKGILRGAGLAKLIKSILNKTKWFRNYRNSFRDTWGVDAITEVFFYQSLPMLDIDGLRPTDQRIKTYGLMNFLKPDMNMLDIGCNVGFFDFSLAGHVKSVLGIEYDKEYVDFAKEAGKILDMSTVEIVQADFNEWVKNNTRKFDVILSFAVHHWLGASPEGYIEILDNLLNPGGYVVFESHISATGWNEFAKFSEVFMKNGFEKYSSGSIDEDESKREWAVFRKR